MSITVKDLFQYDPNFDNAKLQRLTGKKDYQKTDTINLSRLAGKAAASTALMWL